jgi:hypothetical protein
VQTAYANGASTAYLRDVLRLDTVCTPTGPGASRTSRQPGSREQLEAQTHAQLIDTGHCVTCLKA